MTDEEVSTDWMMNEPDYNDVTNIRLMLIK